MDSVRETPEKIAEQVLELANAGASMEALLCFQQWIFALQQETHLNAAWFSLTPVLQACMWLKQHGGVLGLAIVLRTDVIPISLRHLVLHGDSPTSTTANSAFRSEFLVDSVSHVSGFRLGCHDFYEADKNEYFEIKAMAHNCWEYDSLSWHIEVRPDGCLVFRNSNPAWKELLLRGPVREHSVSGLNVVLGAMPLDLDAIHTWEVCVAVSESSRNDPDSIKNEFMLKCVGADTGASKDCFLEATLSDEGKRDSQSFYVSFQERDRLDSGVLPSWRVQQAGFDESREQIEICTTRLLSCTRYNAELIDESLEVLRSGYYDTIEQAKLMVALARMYTMGAITANKLGKATALLSPAIQLHKFHLDICLDPKVRHDSAAYEELEQMRRKIDDTIKMLSEKILVKDEINTID